MRTFGSEPDEYAEPAGGFVELSNWRNNNPNEEESSQQFTNAVRKLEPVVVTTVHSEESDGYKVENTQNNSTFDVFPKSTRASIQMGVTLLFILLLPAAFLTVTSNPEYAFILSVFWCILVSLFLGLIWVVRAVVLKDSRARLFHPLVHAIAERIVQEIQDFHADIRQEFFLLTDGPANEEASRDRPEETRPAPARKSRSILEQPRKPKSAVFRAVVQPFLPLIRRRKARRQKVSNEGDASYEAPTSLV